MISECVCVCEYVLSLHIFFVICDSDKHVLVLHILDGVSSGSCASVRVNLTCTCSVAQHKIYTCIYSICHLFLRFVCLHFNSNTILVDSVTPSAQIVTNCHQHNLHKLNAYVRVYMFMFNTYTDLLRLSMCVGVCCFS